MILDPIDQSIRDRGFNFVPFNRFLTNPFQLPTNQTSSSGITSINQAFRPIRMDSSGGGITAFLIPPNIAGSLGTISIIPPPIRNCLSICPLDIVII